MSLERFSGWQVLPVAHWSSGNGTHTLEPHTEIRDSPVSRCRLGPCTTAVGTQFVVCELPCAYHFSIASPDTPEGQPSQFKVESEENAICDRPAVDLTTTPFCKN